MFQDGCDKMFLLQSFFDFSLREEGLSFQGSRREAGQTFYIAIDLSYQQRSQLGESVQQFSQAAVDKERDRLRVSAKEPDADDEVVDT